MSMPRSAIRRSGPLLSPRAQASSRFEPPPWSISPAVISRQVALRHILYCDEYCAFDPTYCSDCGNTVCEVGESSTNCPQDCPVGVGMVGDPCSGPGDCSDISGGTVECLITLLLILDFTGGYCSASGCSGITPDPCAAAGGVCGHDALQLLPQAVHRHQPVPPVGRIRV